MTTFPEKYLSDEALQRGELFFWIAAVVLPMLFLGLAPWCGNEAVLAEAVRKAAQSENAFPGGCTVPGLPFPLVAAGVALDRFLGAGEFSLRMIVVCFAWLLLLGTTTLCRVFFDRRCTLLAGVLMLGNCTFLDFARTFSGAIPAAACTVWALSALLCGGSRMRYARPFLFCAPLTLSAFFGASGGGVLVPVVSGIFLVCEKRKNGAPRIGFGVAAVWVIAAAASASAIFFGIRAGFVQTPDLAAAWRFRRETAAALFLAMPRLLFPWSIWFFVTLIPLFFRRFRPDGPAWSFLLAVAVLWLPAAILSVAGETVLPFLPAATILTAAFLADDESGAPLKEKSDFAMRWIVMIFSAFVFSSVVVFPAWKTLFEVPVPLRLAIGVFAAGFLALTMLLFDWHAALVFALPCRSGGTVLAALVLTASAFCVIRPGWSGFDGEREFAAGPLRQTLQNLPRYAILCYGNAPGADVVFYADIPADAREAVGEKREKILRDFLEERRGDKVIVIAPNTPAFAEEIGRVGRSAGLDWNTPEYGETPTPFGALRKSRTMFFTGLVSGNKNVEK